MNWKKSLIITLILLSIVLIGYSINPMYNFYQIYRCNSVKKEWKIFYNKERDKFYYGIRLEWVDKF